MIPTAIPKLANNKILKFIWKATISPLIRLYIMKNSLAPGTNGIIAGNKNTVVGDFKTLARTSAINVATILPTITLINGSEISR